MAVSSTTRKQQFTLNQVTDEFDFTFRALPDVPTDIKSQVTTNGTTYSLVYTTDYTVSVESDGNGGTLTLVNAAAVSKGTITVYRETTNTQTSDYDDYNQFPSDTLEEDLDIRTFVSQEAAEDVVRAFKLSVTQDTSLVDTTIPPPSGTKTFGWNSAGDAIINYDNPGVVSAIATAAATAASTSASEADSHATTSSDYATASSSSATTSASEATTALAAAASIPSTPFSIANGGTGIATTGGSLQVLRMKSDVTGLEYGTVVTQSTVAVDDVTIAYSSGTLTVKDSGISQAKLKTSTGEVSVSKAVTDLDYAYGIGINNASPSSVDNNLATYVAHGWKGINFGTSYVSRIHLIVWCLDHTNSKWFSTSTLNTLPGGEYGFTEQLKNTTSGNTGYTYAQQRYVTASGKDHWIFLLVDKETNEVIATYQAPDHPCYGSSGDEIEIPHPFWSYDKSKHEIVVVDNSILTELKPLITRKNSLLTLINQKCLIDDSKRPKYKPREIIEIDEYGDMRGDVIATGKTPDWAKIKIMKDEFELKRRMVETLPENILYKKMRLK